MIYTKNTKKAINIAYEAHMGQKDKLGIPYKDGENYLLASEIIKKTF